jgi:chromosome partitioning protein
VKLSTPSGSRPRNWRLHLNQNRKPGNVVAVVSQKGGVGKTTTAVNLAAAFARRGQTTLLVDTDPQGAVRYGVGLRKGHPTFGFADFLSGRSRLRDVLLPTVLPWLRVILAGSVSDESSHADYLRRVADSTMLADLLQVARERCDLVVVDTPPGLGAIVGQVLASSQHALVPLQCEPLALQTTPQILRGIKEIVRVNPELVLDGILLTVYDPQNPVSLRVAEYVRAHLPAGMVLDVEIPRSLNASDAFAAGQPVLVRHPNDPASVAYTKLAAQLLERYG